MSFVNLSLAGETNTEERFGISLAMSADGTRFLVGASTNIGGGEFTYGGKIYSCSISNNEIIIDSNYVGQANYEFLGRAVALDSSGERYVACGERGTIRIGTISESGAITQTYSGPGELVYAGSSDNLLYGCAVNSDRTILVTTHSNYDSGGLINNGRLLFYTIPTDGTGLTFVDSVDGTSINSTLRQIALNNAGDRFIWGGNNIIYLGTFNGSTAAITDSLTSGSSGIGRSVAMNAAGDRFVAGATNLDNSGGFFVGSFDGTNASIVSSYAYDGPLSNNVGASISISSDGSRFIVGGVNGNAGLLLLGSISEAGAIEVDGTYVGESSDSYLGQVIATDNSAMTFVSSGYESNGNDGAIYCVPPPTDADGDGIFEPTDIFLNQQLNVVPTAIPGLTNVFAIAPGKHHTLAITRDGRVLSFGRNQSGQLGRLITDVSGHVPADVSGASNGYAATEARARLAGGDVYSPADAYADRRRRDALVGLLEAFNGALAGGAGYNEELFRAQLAKLRKQ